MFERMRDALSTRALVRSTFNPFENPSVPLQSAALDNIFGQLSTNDAGESVTEENSMALPIVWRCVSLLSTVIAGCPIRTYRDPGREEVFPKLLSKNNSDMLYTQFELWEIVVVHLALWGNAYIRKIRDAGTEQVLDLHPINPSLVKVKLDRDGNKIFEVKQVSRVTGQTTNQKIIYTDFEVMHVPGLGYDGLQGLAPIALAAQTLGTAKAGDKLAGRFYGKGTQLSGIINIKAPLANQAQADAIRNRWIARNGGTNNAAEVAVLDAETSFQPLTIPPEQLQFLESRRWQTTEIARWFGIPPHLVGDVEKSTSWGTGIEQQNTGFVSYTINGWTNRIEQRVTREVIGINKQYCEFDLDRLLRGDMSERFAAYASAIQWGWITRNEARLRENMPKLDGLDEPLTPLNMQAGSVATESIDPKVAPLGDAKDPTGTGTQPLPKTPKNGK